VIQEQADEVSVRMRIELFVDADGRVLRANLFRRDPIFACGLAQKVCLGSMRTTPFGDTFAVGVTRTRPVHEGAHEARRRAHVAALVGLVARGVLYLVLAVLALGLVFGKSRGNDVDARGAMEELTRHGLGLVLLVLLAIGFSGFALWYAYEALTGHDTRRDGSDRLADGARAVVYGLLCVLAVSFLLSANRGGDTDREEQTWTAKVFDWPGGRLLVGAVGLAALAAGLYLAWRAVSGGRQDSRAVLEAAPRETHRLQVLGALGNAARGAVVALIGIFLVAAALEHDPGETSGVDGSLKRLLDEPYGDAVVVFVAVGLAAFATYSIARAVMNRKYAANAR
jgi:Domain of Unknown Function (DUF1206)